jgi:hypothetical protein
MMPTINNLTPEQVEMLDFMWNELDSAEEFTEWYDCLDSDQQRMADNLQRLVIMESIDEDMLKLKEYPDARRVIDQFRLTK